MDARLLLPNRPIELTDCDKEPVHIPGAIQPFGVLVAFGLPTWEIAHVSRNAPALFGAASTEAMIGGAMGTVLPPKLIHDMRNTYQAAMISGFAERLAAQTVGTKGEFYDILMHASGQVAMAEFVPVAGADSIRSDPATLVKTIIERLRRTTSFKAFLVSAARQIRAVTGYDRVMIYKFLEDDSGEVVAEALRAGLPPFLGLHYPASDIPAQSRALFLRQWLRMIPEVDGACRSRGRADLDGERARRSTSACRRCAPPRRSTCNTCATWAARRRSPCRSSTASGSGA